MQASTHKGWAYVIDSTDVLVAPASRRAVSRVVSTCPAVGTPGGARHRTDRLKSLMIVSLSCTNIGGAYADAIQTVLRCRRRRDAAAVSDVSPTRFTFERCSRRRPARAAQNPERGGSRHQCPGH